MIYFYIMKHSYTKSLIILFLFICSISKAQYAIGLRDTTLIDVTRSSRNVQSYIYYPANSAGTAVAVATPPLGGFPVVVVAHGFSMDYAAFTNFKDSLVPKGYIVIIPNTETGIIGISHSNFGGDLSFLVNYMQQQNLNASSRFYGKVRNKSAILGHSMGGGATYLGAVTNPNVTTTVTFSAAETSPSAITACAAIQVPSLVFSGQNDCVAPAASNQTLMYNALTTTCKTHIIIKNGGHCQYSNSSFTCDFGEGTCRGTSTILTRSQQQPIVFDYLYKWLDFYLRGNCTAYTNFQNLLTTDSRITHNQSCTYSLPIATISNSSSNFKCAEDSVNLFLATSFPIIHWSNAATDSTIHTSNAGNYYAVVTDFMGCSDTSNNISITNLIPTSANIFPNGIINLCGVAPSIAIHASGSQLSNFIWNTTDTGSDITADTIGQYYVQSIDSNGCIGFSDTLHLISTNPIQPILNLSDSVFVCPNDSVEFSLNTIFNSYEWADSSINNTFVSNHAETVYVATIDSNGCAANSDTAYVSFYPYIIPLIINNLDSLEAMPGYLSYTWYNDVNTLLSTDRIFHPLVNARAFILVVVDSNGCTSDRVATLFSFSVGIDNKYENQVAILPNPFENSIIFNYLDKENQLVILDDLGREIYSSSNISYPSFTLNTSDYESGIYIIKIKSANKEYITKMIK